MDTNNFFKIYSNDYTLIATLSHYNDLNIEYK